MDANLVNLIVVIGVFVAIAAVLTGVMRFLISTPTVRIPNWWKTLVAGLAATIVTALLAFFLLAIIGGRSSVSGPKGSGTPQAHVPTPPPGVTPTARGSRTPQPTKARPTATPTHRPTATPTPRPTPSPTPSPSPTPTPTPTATPVPPHYESTSSGGSPTFTNYSNAGGTSGQRVGAYWTIEVSCRLTGWTAPDGNNWWYRLPASPWNGAFYAPADDFYNNGQTSGSLSGTPFVDTNVPYC